MIETPSVLKSIKMLDDQVLEIVFDDNVKVTLKGVAEVFTKLYEISDNKRVARILIMGKGMEITNAARLAIAEENKTNKALIIAEAVVVNSFYQKVSTNFYMSFTKRRFPSQFFTDTKIAMEWLDGAIKKSNRRKSK